MTEIKQALTIIVEVIVLFLLPMVLLTFLILNIGNFLLWGYKNPTMGLIAYSSICCALSIVYFVFTGYSGEESTNISHNRSYKKSVNNKLAKKKIQK